GGVGQEDADLAVLDLPQPPAPLAGDAAGGAPLLGEAGGIEDKGTAVVAEFLGHVALEFVQDGAVVPAAGADEQLQGAALLAGLGGDGLGGLALQAGQLAAQDGEGVAALLLAVGGGEGGRGGGGG